MATSSVQGPGSVSRIECTASVKGKGTAQISLYRHLAPLTVDAISWALPMDGRVNVQQAMVCAFTSIKVGVEKARLSFERGEVGFLASGGLLCTFLQDVKSAVPINPVGKVDSGIEVLGAVRVGDVIRLARTVD